MSAFVYCCQKLKLCYLYPGDRCSRDCSLTPLNSAAVTCEGGHPLRAEKVYSVELRTAFREFVSSVTWQDIYDATVGHRCVVPESMCCIKCSPRFREKMQEDSIQNLVSIPILVGGDGLPLNHGKFGIARSVWLNTVFNVASPSVRRERMIGSLIGGPVLPSSLRTSMWPMRRELSSLYLPFWAKDIRSEDKLCRIILLGVMGDGQGIKKMVGSNWTGKWSCPSCKLRFVELSKGRWITPDFRVFLPRNHPFRTDRRFGEACLDDPPK